MITKASDSPDRDEVQKAALQLSRRERIDLAQEIWDSIAGDSVAEPLSQPQREELDRRLDDLDHGGSRGQEWKGVRERIEGRKRSPRP